MNTHVFIVNEQTFKYHLEYMFAGTGAGDKKSPFYIMLQLVLMQILNET